MSQDDIERRLHEALDAQARASVGDHAQPPLPRYLSPLPRHRAHRRARILAPLAAAAAVAAVVVSVVALQGPSGKTHLQIVGGPSTAPTTERSVAATPVHIKLLNSDGSTYGVGMPVIAFFSRKITSGKALQQATKATVDGKPLAGAWYFEYSSYYKGYPIEAHWRPQNYWPAHAKVHVAMPTRGLSAGTGLAFDDSLTLDFATGPRNIAVVDDATHTMSVTTDDHAYGTFPVSLGARNTPTSHGIKVIMEKGRSICMSGPGYHECGVKDTQRLTYGGEYLHAAPWNTWNIEHGIDSSNGCTNLLPGDAQKLYSFLEVGDVVQYPNANGAAMQLGSGYGDWNISWSAWQSGGLIPTH